MAEHQEGVYRATGSASGGHGERYDPDRQAVLRRRGHRCATSSPGPLAVSACLLFSSVAQLPFCFITPMTFQDLSVLFVFPVCHFRDLRFRMHAGHRRPPPFAAVRRSSLLNQPPTFNLRNPQPLGFSSTNALK